jgi:2,3-bisphosphoglycerate-independent phosphoglycerate mutase
MDRDKRWDRLKVAYEALVAGKNVTEADYTSIFDVMKKKYGTQREGTTELETDEFLKPIVLSKEGRIKDHDTLVFIDFRADRMRQIVETVGLKRNFDTDVKHPDDLHISCMTRYNKEFPFPLLFPPVSHKNVMAEWLAVNGLTQFHCAETEKYAHVTFFFNGGREAPFENEERCLVHSPKVATYDLKPDMSSFGVGDRMVEIIKAKKHPFVMCNFAPPDMVGHTGVYTAAVKACEATDTNIGRVEQACKENGYVMFVTADHGNAEKMLDDVGKAHTAHTCYPVPFVSTGSHKLKMLSDRKPALRDVIPTCLAQMGVPIPPEMDGVSLLE